MTRANTVYLERRGEVAEVVLNRPEVLNAENPQMMNDFHAVLDELEAVFEKILRWRALHFGTVGLFRALADATVGRRRAGRAFRVASGHQRGGWLGGCRWRG